MFQHGMETARQLLQPAAFRITAPEDTVDEAPVFNADHRLQESLQEQLNTVLKATAAVATAVWRVQSKLETVADGELPDPLRNLPRHIQSAWDALRGGNIQINDPTGSRYIPGMAVNVLAIQPVEGISCETIHEIIKPTVYFNDLLIQQADVIVARPADVASQVAADFNEKPCPDSHTHNASDQKGLNPDGSDDH
jgi:hypothetical protein